MNSSPRTLQPANLIWFSLLKFGVGEGLFLFNEVMPVPITENPVTQR
jgi:hypothetical protein